MTAQEREKVPFVRVPLWWAAEAAKATRDPAALVCIRLLYVAWETQRLTVPLSNVWPKQHGVSRSVKRRVLRDLEAAGLITVERTDRKSPLVTLVML